MSQNRPDRGRGGVHNERRHKEQNRAKEAEEEQRVLYLLVYRVHCGDVGGVRLCRQCEVDRHRVGIEDAGYETSGEGGAGQREAT
jgi:hypothetical protein